MQLSESLDDVFRLADAHKSALGRLNIRTVRDLLWHFPFRYETGGDETTVAGLVAGQEASLVGTLEKLETKKSWKRRIPVSEGYLRDQSGRIKIRWFNQPYIAKMYQDGALVKATGKVSGTGEKIYLANPELERVSLTETGLFAKTPTPPLAGRGPDRSVGADNSLFAVYAESRGVTSLWFRHNIAKLLTIKDGPLWNIEDPIPAELLKRYNLPTLKTALVWIHTPRSAKDAEAARKRFAFEEVFFIQLERGRERVKQSREKSFAVDAPQTDIESFVKTFPFDATKAQKRAIDAILTDMKSGHPMSRLLEGDVGSGKTAVAATAVWAVTRSHPPLLPHGSASGPRSSASYQAAYMAPTEILAKQHFESFIKYFESHPINIGLITGSGCYKFPSKVHRGAATNISRAQLLKWVANGEIPVLIGTHALIQKSVQFKHLALVVIDEQHRFGVSQRKALASGKRAERTQNDAEEKIDPLLYRDLTYRIRNALFAVKKELGGGHKEIIYQRAVAEEFTKANLSFSREVRIPITYRKKEVGTYVPDFVVENKIIVELKALNFIGTTEKKQIWSYLKGSDYHLALLVNFGSRALTIDRIIYDKARDSASVQHSSVSVPHLLSMTATPIPRTLALTIYGDLDLTLLDEMPPGRKRVITEIVAPDKRAGAYEKIREELEAGRQAYVICPRIDEPDPDKAFALQAKSVKAEAKRLKKEVFPEYELAILHSKMKPGEKDEVMRKFYEHEADILVATSVVEVGVNVPNATCIIIEGAERFGLSQLHQLRGRVVRSTYQTYCFACPESKGEQTLARLKAFTTAKNGFELAEHDLLQRGAGQLGGTQQWGISDVGMEALKNLKLVEAARAEALSLVEKDENLSRHPLLAESLAARAKTMHFE